MFLKTLHWLNIGPGSSSIEGLANAIRYLRYAHVSEFSKTDFGPDVTLDNPAFIHPSVLLYGKISVARDASIWPNTVVRAENFDVSIGQGTNIQDFVMIHVGGGTGTHIGANCSITHHCTIHGATIGDNCLIGINATIMDGAVVGDNCIVAGGAFLKEGTIIPDNSIVMGMPGKVTKTRNNQVANRLNAFLYVINAKCYARGEHRSWNDPDFMAQAAAEVKRLQAEFDQEAAGE